MNSTTLTVLPSKPRVFMVPTLSSTDRRLSDKIESCHDIHFVVTPTAFRAPVTTSRYDVNSQSSVYEVTGSPDHGHCGIMPVVTLATCPPTTLRRPCCQVAYHVTFPWFPVAFVRRHKRIRADKECYVCIVSFVRMTKPFVLLVCRAARDSALSWT